MNEKIPRIELEQSESFKTYLSNNLFPNYYISSLGEVYSIKKECFLKPDKHGYFTIVISRGKSKKYTSKQLIALCKPKHKGQLISILKGHPKKV